MARLTAAETFEPDDFGGDMRMTYDVNVREARTRRRGRGRNAASRFTPQSASGQNDSKSRRQAWQTQVRKMLKH